MSNYKIIMTGGGTAGHVTPNLALVPKLKEKGFDIKYLLNFPDEIAKYGIPASTIISFSIPS